jgi:hypothetical protein
MPGKQRLHKKLDTRTVVRLHMTGLERFAEVLNDFERNPMQLDEQGEPLEGWDLSPIDRLGKWLKLFAGIDDAVMIGAPIQIEGATPARIVGLGEVMSALAARLLGKDVSALHLIRCDTCHRWMATRYRNRQRHKECHSTKFTRAERNKRRLARELQAADAARAAQRRRKSR